MSLTDSFKKDSKPIINIEDTYTKKADIYVSVFFVIFRILN